MNINSQLPMRRSVTIPWGPLAQIPQEHAEIADEASRLSSDNKRFCVRYLEDSYDEKIPRREGDTKDLDPSPERAVRIAKLLGHKYLLEAEGTESQGVMKASAFHRACLEGPRSEVSVLWDEQGSLQSYHCAFIEDNIHIEERYQVNPNGTLTYTSKEIRLAPPPSGEARR